MVRCRSDGPGFTINNVVVKGGIMAYKNVWMMWNVKNIADVTPESLAFVRLLRPVPDLVIFGSGATAALAPRETLKMLKTEGIHIESLNTVRPSCSILI